jgi:ATP-dependent Clp protease ATP-binding subunit ClpB
VLDDGRLTDGQGRTVDFRNTVIVMTSNLGSHIITELSGKSDYEGMKAAVMEVVGGHFRPEFINRIDESIVFHPLGREQIRHIVGIQLAGLQGRLKARDLTLTISEAAMDLLGELGFDPIYGARPLKRAISQHLENSLAMQLLQGRYVAGSEIKVDVQGENLVFL